MARKLPEGAVELPENRVSRFTGSDGRFYDMRTYMVPNDSVFYVTVAASGRQLAFEEGKRNAGSTASLAVCLAAMFTIPKAKSGRLSCAVKRDIKKGAVIGRPLSLLTCRVLECAVDAFASFD